MIYVIGPDSGPYKIGKAVDVKRRLVTIQVSNWIPLNLITSFDGGYDLEQHLHHIFAKKRGLGEWFYLTNEDLGDLDKIVFEFKSRPIEVRLSKGKSLCDCGKEKSLNSNMCKFCYAGNPELWGKKLGSIPDNRISEEDRYMVIEFKDQFFEDLFEEKTVGSLFVSEFQKIKSCNLRASIVYEILRSKGYIVKPGAGNKTIIHGLSRKMVS